MNSPYLLIPLGVLSTGLYFYSRLLSKFGIITTSLHRRIWNVILLAVFLTTAALGILLVIQINYKLEWPVVETLLKWHVDFGIALSFVALFHFTWHLKYYLKILKKKPASFGSSRPVQMPVSYTTENLFVYIFLSGFTATVMQVLLIREITTVFQGNELTIAWTLGIWMLGTGLGALAGRSLKMTDFSTRYLKSMLLWISVIPVVMAIVMNLMRNILFPPGTLVNPGYFVLMVIFILFPVCILAGMLFSVLVKEIRNNRQEFITVYAIESIGSMAGGIIVSLIMVHWLGVIQSILIVVFIVPAILFIKERKRADLIRAVIFLIPLVLSFLYPAGNYLKSFLFIHQQIRESRETFFGNITITENSGQYSFFGNGSLLFTSDNVISSEEFVHYAMLQRDSPGKVLLIGGGIAGMLTEILKYPSVSRIDYVELNPRLITLSEKYIQIPRDGKVNFIFSDGRKFLTGSSRQYDVVILALPDPSSLLVNRYYTDEFFYLLKRRLNNGAVVLISHSPSGNYVSPEMAEIEGCVYHTLQTNFRFTEIVPGDRDYFIASDEPVTREIASLVSNRSIENKYVNEYYMDDRLISQRSENIKNNISMDTPVNSDFKPLPVFFHSLHFIKVFNPKAPFLLALPVLLLILPVFFMKPVTAGIYSAGFTASSIEIIIIFLFQALFGYVYSAIGLIIAFFMFGLAAGSFAGYFRIPRKEHLVSGQFFLAVYAALFPVIAFLLYFDFSHIIKYLVFIIATLLVSAIVGFQFAAGTQVRNGPVSYNAAVLYAADLVGSSLGVILITVILLPLLGLKNSCFLIAGINLIAMLNMIFRKSG